MPAEPPAWLQREAVRAPLATQFLQDGAELRVSEDWIQVLRPNEPHPAMNEVIFSRLGPDADAAIDATFAEYATIPTGFKWSVPVGSAPDDLGERLRARGMRSWWARAMWCPTDLQVSELEATDVTDVPAAFQAVSSRGWGTPPEHHAQQHAALQWAVQTGRIGLFVAGRGAGSASVAATERAGYLMGAVVLPGQRGRGHYGALLASRLRWLQGRGLAYAVTLAREATSAPILERRGFGTLFRYEVFEWSPTDAISAPS